MFLQGFDQIGWCSRSKPVRIYFLAIHGSDQAERIENIFCMFTEMIAVVILSQFFQALIVCQTERPSGFIAVVSSVLLMPQMAEYWSSMLMLSRLLSSLKMLSCENLVMPVMNVNSR